MNARRRHLGSGIGPNLLCLLLFTASMACEPPPEEVAEIRIGVIAPFSGPYAEPIGRQVREGARLAADEVNDRGGLRLDGRRHRVALLLEDSEDRPEATVGAARKLINQDEVVALVGPILSRNAIAAAAVAERKRTPMITPAATHAEVTAGKRYVFRATFVDDQQGRALARFARDELGAERAAALYDVASAYNRSIAEIFRQVFEESGGRVVAFESYTTGELDFRAALARIAAAAPEVLLLPNYTDEVPLQVAQAHEAGLGATFLGGDAWNGDLYSPQEIFDGSFFANDWMPVIVESADGEAPGGKAREFLAAFRRAYGHDPTPMGALTYDALGLLLAAVERSGRRDAEAVRDTLANTGGYSGVTGSFSYRGSGDPVKSLVIYQIRDGGVSYRQRIRPK